MNCNSIKKLTPRHLKICDYCIEGLTPKQIAEKLSMSARAIGIVVNSPAFQHQLALRRKSFEDSIDERLSDEEVTAATILKKAGAKAASSLVLGLEAQSEALRIRSAESILDRSGTVKPGRLEDSSNQPIIHITKEDLQLLNETLQLEQQIIESNKPKQVVSNSLNEKVNKN